MAAEPTNTAMATPPGTPKSSTAGDTPSPQLIHPSKTSQMIINDKAEMDAADIAENDTHKLHNEVPSLASPIWIKVQTTNTTIGNLHNEEMDLDTKCLDSVPVNDNAPNSSLSSSAAAEHKAEDEAKDIDMMDLAVDALEEADSDIDEGEEIDLTKVKYEWLGTSFLGFEERIKRQASGVLDELNLPAYRKHLAKVISLAPHHPTGWLELAECDQQLGFSDIATASAYKALLLIQAGLGIQEEPTYPTNLGDFVRFTVAVRLSSTSDPMIDDELESLHLKAYQEILAGFLGCEAYWDGIKMAEKGLAIFPRDKDLLFKKKWLREAYLDRCAKIKEEMGGDASVSSSDMSKTGRIFIQKYGWLDEALYIRTPTLVRKINRNFGVGNAEVKPCVFGDAKPTTAILGKNADVGPLGVFAARDIKKDELILIDTTVNTFCSDIPTNTLQRCDACQAILRVISPGDIIYPKCCQDVAYCSKGCYNAAIKGYHKVLCGKDISWLFKQKGLPKDPTTSSRWHPGLFLRMLAGIITDVPARGSKTSMIHPLKHHVVARMVANYPEPDQFLPSYAQWQFFSNVVAPTRSLMLLNIDPFTTNIWTPEVIQTMLWRIDNNANQSRPPTDKSLGTAANIININSQYLMINHSCLPNCDWLSHGYFNTDDVPEGFCIVEATKEAWFRPGSSTVTVSAKRDIKKGEECKITYIGHCDPDKPERAIAREKLNKWFSGGCGCEACTKEAAQEQEEALENLVKRITEAEGTKAGAKLDTAQGDDTMEGNEDLK